MGARPGSEILCLETTDHPPGDCYRSSLPLRKDGILLEARKNVPDMDGRPSLLTVDLNTPEGRECSRSATRLQRWVSEGLENAPPIWLR
ncbi:rCG33163 [Rattus norvegicus]|uniref:RCG33163 n=1 Tax=Rattus norvegicus TaxID=10116 RepID=A6HIG2_RAT|nr:rCG33163 [Rattus norvegicus]